MKFAEDVIPFSGGDLSEAQALKMFDDAIKEKPIRWCWCWIFPLVQREHR